MARLRFAEDGFGAAAGAELVVEVISERVDIKRRFYEELACVVSPSALIASNTSVLDIFEHAPSVLHPQLIMAHYFVPAHIIPLVEIVGHPSNPGQLVPQFAACLSALGMKPVVLKRFARGFIVNRIQRAINQELFQLLDEGVADLGDIVVRATENGAGRCRFRLSGRAPCRDGVPVQTGFHRA